MPKALVFSKRAGLYPEANWGSAPHRRTPMKGHVCLEDRGEHLEKGGGGDGQLLGGEDNTLLLEGLIRTLLGDN